MAKRGKKSEKFNILEEIYHGKGEKNQQQGSIKEFFQNSQNIEWFLSAAILFFGLSALIIGFSQIKGHFAFNSSAVSEENNVVTKKTDDLLGLKNKDTDADGLSDYDEIYLYGTSAYLQDTDSDGISDKDEIALGQDPNCPKGSNCFADFNTSGEIAAIPSTDDLLFGGTSVVEYIRRTMIDSGMPVTEVNKYSDEELLAAYNEALNQIESMQSGQQTTINADLDKEIKDLSPDEIRKMLVEAGANKDLINLVSDEELMELVEETLTEQGLNN